MADLERRAEDRERELEKQRNDSLAQLIREREENCTLQTSLDGVTSDLQKSVCYGCYHGNRIVVCVSRAQQAVQVSAGREVELEREWKERVREAERRVGSRTQAALQTLAQERDKVRD